MKHTANDLEQLAQAILRRLGSDEQEARIVSHHLIEANLRGHDSHGVGMLTFYVQSKAAGTLVPNHTGELVNDAGAILQFDGHRGLGQRVVHDAVDQALERVKQTGVVLMTVRNSHHMGRIGTYGEQVAAAGKVGLFFVNVQDFAVPLVAPFSGSEPRFGTNPMCIAFPATDKQPNFIMDFATSIVAFGKTRVAYLAGKKMKDEVMLDAKGIPTNDPVVMHEEPKGALRAFAEHKGGGLIAAVEFLAGLLSGGGTIQPGNPRLGGIVNNMMAVIIDPAKMSDVVWMREEYQAMVDYIKSSPAAFADQPVLMAGEPELRTRQQRLEEGIDISEHEWQGIVAAARQIGVAESLLA